MARWTGRSVEVMTVDPAPRLLDALGLDASSATPQPSRSKASSIKPAALTSRLRALKLDPKATFDALVEALRSLGQGRARHILENRIYRNLSGALSGVGDYMAMEKLLELISRPARSDRARYAAGQRGDRFSRRAAASARAAQLARDDAARAFGWRTFAWFKMVDFAARTVLERVR